MKIHWEATLTSHAEGIVELETEEITHYNSLIDEDERKAWLHKLVCDEAPYDIHFTSVDTADWWIEEED
jgi:hypothetical protein